MVRPTKKGPPRFGGLLDGAIGYDPTDPTGEVPDTIDLADDASWFVPYVSTADIAFIQSKTATNTTTDADITATFDSAPTEGNLLIAVIARREIYTDVSLTGWTRYPDADGLHVNDQPGSPNGSNGSVHIFYKIAGAGEASAVTISANGSALKALIIAEFSGGTTFDTASNTGTGTTQATSLTTGNLTPAASENALLIGVILQSTIPALTIGGSFTEIDQTICDTLGPGVIVGYRIVDPTSGSYAMTASSDQNDTYAGMLLSFLADVATETFLPALAVNDGDPATFDYALEASVAAADGVFLLGHLVDDYQLATVELLLGLEDAGSATVTMEGAVDEAFTIPVALDAVTQVSAGSYAPETWAFDVAGADGYLYVRFVLTVDQGTRPYEVELYGPPDPADAISDHLADTTDAHDASAVSYDNDTSGLTAEDVQAAIDEIAVLAGGTLRWEAVTNGEDVFVWEGDDLVHEYKEYL